MRVLSLGAGVQSSALLLLAVKGEIECDGVVFADTGSEKPTTYEFLAELQKILAESSLPYRQVVYTGDGWDSLHTYCLKYRIMPSTIRRWCTDKFKVSPIKKVMGKGDVVMVGFSYDEQHRVKNYRLSYERTFPLIELEMTQADCTRVILDYGLPLPTKSACFLCPFQHSASWKWLKSHYPELFEKALEVERTYYERKPGKRDVMGLYSGSPLWKAMGTGFQYELPFGENFGCLSGHCFH